MTQDKAHPTPPAVPSEREAFEAWYGARRGTGVLGKIATGRYEWDATQDAWLAFQAGRATAPSLAAPVASNTTAEPAPIQPAGVEVERDVKYPDMDGDAVPEIGSKWSHSNGDTYTVIGYADMFSQSHAKRPPRVIYRSQKTGRVWSRVLSDWYRAHAPAAASQGDRGKT